MDRNDLIDIWKIRNPMEKRYSWRQKYPNIQCRLDSFLISVGLGNITRKTDISYGFKSDHSFILLEIDKQNLKKDFINLTHLFCLMTSSLRIYKS